MKSNKKERKCNERGESFKTFKLDSYNFLKNAYDNNDYVFLEQQFYKLCSLSHTLVLKDGQYPDQAIKSFTLSNLLNIHLHVKQKVFQGRDVTISQQLLDNIKNLVQTCSFSSRESVEDVFYEFERNNRAGMTKSEKVVFNSFKQMALNLPVGQFIKPINEMDLKVNYLNPFLQVYINKDTHLLKWPEVNPKERLNRTSRKKRPDAIIYTINQAMLGAEVAFGEVKSVQSQSRTRSLCLDLYRILHFSKDIVDCGYKQVLTFQCIGQKISFYIYILLGESFYVMTELFSLQIPLNVHDICNLSIDDFYNLCTIQYLLDNSLLRDIPDSWKRVSMETPDFSQLVANRTCDKNDTILF